MQSIKQSLSHLSNQLSETTLLEERECNICGETYKKSRIHYLRDFGPHKKGSVQVVEMPCNCKILQDVHHSVKRNKVAKITKFSQFNYALSTATLYNFKFDLDPWFEEETKRFVIAAREYNDGDVFYIWGDTGVGKSHLAMGMHKYYLENGKVSLFLNLTQLYDLFKKSYEKDSEFHESDIMDAILQTDMLILDDVGVIDETDFERTKLYSVLNIRQGKSIIFTSNHDVKSLKKRYGDATGSRFFEGLVDENIYSIHSRNPYRERGVN